MSGHQPSDVITGLDQAIRYARSSSAMAAKRALTRTKSALAIMGDPAAVGT
jgi:hypothetical protein